MPQDFFRASVLGQRLLRSSPHQKPLIAQVSTYRVNRSPYIRSCFIPPPDIKLIASLECESSKFVGEGGTGEVTAQLLEFVTLIYGAAHSRLEAEPLFTDTALLGMLPIKAGNRLQAEHFLACSGAERDAVGAGSRLQGRHGVICATLSLLRLLSGQYFLALAFVLPRPGTHPNRFRLYFAQSIIRKI